ncbi:hypothetical protein BEL04_10280 [Mucilaginibacter sp. PPCGB 2223]|uniref:DUF4397 domain-containing protein n=1 Tax=Mucilaginibacter sp. PPCGB 2223 TaxID=1886027 RepID=UPI000825BBB5|nr:DUF4397 domain-containing protein [Mucilaginibacter sp. PPCGB 2223]OCX54609.1 hypothetical protein BEL04_10280 [Mucilaginibacter sp. PPCGB 2223]
MTHRRTDNLVVKSLLAIVISILTISLLPSCGKTAVVSPSSSTTKLCVVDASPDLLPMQVYLGSLQLGTIGKFFNYPTITSYYPVYSGEQVMQVRNHYQTTVFYVDSVLKDNRNYSLFVTGLASATTHADTLTYILTTDYSTLPDLGYGKIRFVNASPRTAGLDITANGTTAFTNVTYKKVTSYIQVPAGIYAFKINATATPASTLSTLSNITVQDGRLYTIYSRGLVGRTDSAAFTASVITNQ